MLNVLLLGVIILNVVSLTLVSKAGVFLRNIKLTGQEPVHTV
jgi:hypothetical protein